MGPCACRTVCFLLVLSALWSVTPGRLDFVKDADERQSSFFDFLGPNDRNARAQESAEANVHPLMHFFSWLVPVPGIKPHCSTTCDGKEKPNECKGDFYSSCKVDFLIPDGNVSVLGEHGCVGIFRHHETDGNGYLESKAQCDGSLQRRTNFVISGGSEELKFTFVLWCGIKYDFHATLHNDPFDMHIADYCLGAKETVVFKDAGMVSSESLWMGELGRAFAALSTGIPRRGLSHGFFDDQQVSAYQFGQTNITCNGQETKPMTPCKGLYNSTTQSDTASLGQECVGTLTPIFEKQEDYLWAMTACRGLEIIEASLEGGPFSLKLIDTCTTEEFVKVYAHNAEGLYMDWWSFSVGKSSSSTRYTESSSAEPPMGEV